MSKNHTQREAMSYAEAVHTVTALHAMFTDRRDVILDDPTRKEVLTALQICKNAAIECAARAAKKG